MRLSTLSLALLLVPLTAAPPAAAQPEAAQPEAALDLVADGFTHPLALAEPPDDSGRLFVVDQTGQIWIVTAEGERLGEPFLDIADRLVELNHGYDERGLLGLAFHPDYAQNGRFFVFYSAPLRESAPDGFDHTNVLAEFRASPTDADRADPASEQKLLQMDHPYMNHNAGTLAFGPGDGMLYVALGDGGLRDDQDQNFVQGRPEDWYELNDGGNGQDIENNLLGSILRIDVNAEAGGGHHGSGNPYKVPEDNPFAEIPGVHGEVWAYGLRNPWRFSFDMAGDHELISADVGQNLYDEISVIQKGGNYGWNVWEGAHCFNAASPTDPFETCPTETGVGHPVEGDPLLMPVIETKNAGYFDDGAGVAIVGGYVYRGPTLPRLGGQYVFGVYSRSMEGGHQPGRVFVATREGDAWPFEEMTFANRPDGGLDRLLLSFGQDRAGEVYVLVTDQPGLEGASGWVYRLVPSP
ncbi:MAG: PQQ-dependent sugar dehydrogenase [Rhodothermales bacterium]